MLGEIWEQIINFLDREDILSLLKSNILLSHNRIVCNMCSYRKKTFLDDNIYNLEYIFDYCGGNYYLKKSTCGVYLNGICDHCSKKRGNLKFCQSAFLFHNLKDYLHMEKKVLESNYKNVASVNLSSNLMSDRVPKKYRN